MIEITSRDNPLLKQIRKQIQDPAGYRKSGQVWVEGEHLCSAALLRGSVPEALVVKRSAWSRQTPPGADMARKCLVVEDALFDELSTLESPADYGFLLSWPGLLQADVHTPTVVLDRLQDPGNVGAILRSASAFGFKQVLAIKGTVALWSPKVLRAGMGAHFGLSVVEGLAVDDLDALGLPLVATSSHAQHALGEVVLPKPCAWVFGHEGQGVSAGLLARCERVVRIPQPGGEESLNVAAAAAICLYESARPQGPQYTSRSG